MISIANKAEMPELPISRKEEGESADALMRLAVTLKADELVDKATVAAETEEEE